MAVRVVVISASQKSAILAHHVHPAGFFAMATCRVGGTRLRAPWAVRPSSKLLLAWTTARPLRITARAISHRLQLLIFPGPVGNWPGWDPFTWGSWWSWGVAPGAPVPCTNLCVKVYC